MTSPSAGSRASVFVCTESNWKYSQRKVRYDSVYWTFLSMSFCFSRAGQSSVQGSDWLLSQVQYISHPCLRGRSDVASSDSHHVCDVSDVGTSEAICRGFLSAHSTANNHGRRTKPLLEWGAAAAVQVTTPVCFIPVQRRKEEEKIPRNQLQYCIFSPEY